MGFFGKIGDWWRNSDENWRAERREEETKKWYDAYDKYNAARTRINNMRAGNMQIPPDELENFRKLHQEAMALSPDQSNTNVLIQDAKKYGLTSYAPQATPQNKQIYGPPNPKKAQAQAKKAQARAQAKKAEDGGIRKDPDGVYRNTPMTPTASMEAETTTKTSATPTAAETPKSKYKEEDLSLDKIMSLYQNIQKLQNTPGADQFVLNFLGSELASRIAARNPGPGMTEDQISSGFGGKPLDPIAAMVARQQRSDFLRSNLETQFDRSHTTKPEWWDRVKNLPVATQNTIYSNYNPETGGFSPTPFSQQQRQSLSQQMQQNYPNKPNPWAADAPKLPTGAGMSGMPMPYTQQPTAPQMQPTVPVMGMQAPSYEQYGNLSPGQDMSDRFGYNALIHQMSQQAQPPSQA